MARANFHAGWNCCQAVLLAFKDIIGLPEEQTAALGSGFGGGMGRMREVCGAVSAMTFMAGVITPSTDPSDQAGRRANYALVQELAGLFKEENGGQVGAPLDFAAVANAMPATQEKAPYLIHPIMGESAEFDEFVSEMLAEAGQGTITEARYYANVIDEVLEKLLADGKTSIDTGWFTAAPAINGSVPYCNSEPTEENFVYIALLPCLDTRKLVAMMPLASSASDKAFDIKEGDAMYRPEEERVTIW